MQNPCTPRITFRRATTDWDALGEVLNSAMGMLINSWVCVEVRTQIIQWAATLQAGIFLVIVFYLNLLVSFVLLLLSY